MKHLSHLLMIRACWFASTDGWKVCLLLSLLVVNQLQDDHGSNPEEHDEDQQDKHTPPAELVLKPEEVLHVLPDGWARLQVLS